jgi:hypothetical protein
MKINLTRTLKAGLTALSISVLLAARALAADDRPANEKDPPAPAPANTAPNVENPQAPAAAAPGPSRKATQERKIEANGQVQGQVPGRANAGDAQPNAPNNNRQGAIRHQTNRAYSNDPNGPRAGAEANVNARRNMRGNANVGLTFGANTGAGGLQISSIGPNGYFGNVGFQPGDQIISAGGQQFNNQNAFYGWLGTVQVGQRVPIIVNRNGQQQTVYWTPTQEFTQQYAGATPATGQRLLGIVLDDQQQDAAVVASVEPNSPAQQAGVRPNDMIVAVSGRQVSSPNEFADTIAQVPQGSAVDLAVSRTMNLHLATGVPQAAGPQSATGNAGAGVVSPAPAQQYNQQPARRGLLRRGR